MPPKETAAWHGPGEPLDVTEQLEVAGTFELAGRVKPAAT